MMLKKSKEDILKQIQSQVYGDIYSQLSAMHGQPVSNFGGSISNAVACAVQNAFKILIEETYTTQDFEKDIGLR